MTLYAYLCDWNINFPKQRKSSLLLTNENSFEAELYVINTIDYSPQILNCIIKVMNCKSAQ